MPLTPEEKEKIYEEEKARLEAIDKTNKKKASIIDKNQANRIGLIVIAILFVVFTIQHQVSLRNNPVKPDRIPLQAKVHANGMQMSITNNDDFNWSNVKVYINVQSNLGNHYSYTADVIKSNEIYTINILDFAKADGTRFNPYATKILDVSIFCDTPKGEGSAVMFNE